MQVDKPRHLTLASCLAGILFGCTLIQPLSSNAVEKSKVSTIPRWNLYERVGRIEDTMCTKDDAAEMKREMKKDMVDMKREMMGFSLGTTFLTQLIPIKKMIDENNVSTNDEADVFK